MEPVLLSCSEGHHIRKRFKVDDDILTKYLGFFGLKCLYMGYLDSSDLCRKVKIMCRENIQFFYKYVKGLDYWFK